MSIIIAVDTGGTFTDAVALSGGMLRVAKVPSTPEDPARAVAAALEAAGGGSDVGLLVHGSTVATNTLLERSGARVLLITNRGFEDVIEIARQDRPQLYALHGTRPPPLVAREDRIGIEGRLDERGRELVPLDRDAVRALQERLAATESVAVCLLHSYADDVHERAVAALLETDAPVTLSSALLREYREYERCATTVVNAYVAPRMGGYLERVDAMAGRVRVMGSGGGALRVERARREPVHTVLSGPAGGIAGARAIAARAGLERIITFDMGGTSTDVALCPGAPLHTRELRIDGVPIAIPVLDIHTVGAGGGSIAHVDAGGALRVGPRSAGAAPGPICYGAGGTDVTVTDANVWLGRLPAAAWAHARPLSREAIAAPLGQLADQLGGSPDAAAEGVIDVVNTSMEGALRVISVERGYEPTDFTLVAFGGAAGLHACELAQRLGVPRVLVPPAPGVLSAFGMLVAPVLKQAARTVLARGRAHADFLLADAFSVLEAEARAELAEEDVAYETVVVRHAVDARYRGQSYELTVSAQGDWVGRFHEAHARRFGHSRPGAEVEAVTLRVEAEAPAPLDPAAAVFPASGAPRLPTPTRLVFGGAATDARLLARAHVGAGLEGPAVIVEYSATTLLPPGWRVEDIAGGALLLGRSDPAVP
ncbi:MAG TPA: hydantoinase/oxoprolinase family protein [Longimicrobiales bacterium]|nr:hydantoinase/oxoprolinase family protein [Longimicrobiales bacterium]